MRFLRNLLYPFSLLYKAVILLRNYCYDRGFFKTTTFKTPLICVGNLSVGGTGKTPMIEYLIRLLSVEYKIATLSRGYKRKSKGFVLADTNSTVLDLGDEPFQFYQKFKDTIAVGVDANRVEGVSVLEKQLQPDVVLLDDAFQHRKITPSYAIVLTSFQDLYYNDCMLPTGNLRDTKNQIKRADMVVVTKCPTTITPAQKQHITQRITKKHKIPVFFATIAYSDTLQTVNKASKAIAELQNTRFTLVTGIANPSPLVAFLKEKGFIFEHLNYPDHHAFSKKEIAFLQQKQMVITTEKDFMRLKDSLDNAYYIAIEMRFLQDKEALNFNTNIHMHIKQHKVLS